MPNKSLGQHWLKDRLMLEAIADSAELSLDDTVLEIGPGLGTLTSSLLSRAKRVVAIEYDTDLARKLPGQFPGKNLEVVPGDILDYDLDQLPAGYVVVANVPYYITAKIMQRLVRAGNQPDRIIVLVQQEVAEKIAAQPGTMTPLTIELQCDYNIHLGIRVPKMYFTPPPKVNSQVVICKKLHVDKNAQFDKKQLMKLVHAGFSSPRKMLRSSLAGGLDIPKQDIEQLLVAAGVDENLRAQDLSLYEWQQIMAQYITI